VAHVPPTSRNLFERDDEERREAQWKVKEAREEKRKEERRDGGSWL
jgi:hypothetical protein